MEMAKEGCKLEIVRITEEQLKLGLWDALGKGGC